MITCVDFNPRTARLLCPRAKRPPMTPPAPNAEGTDDRRVPQDPLSVVYAACDAADKTAGLWQWGGLTTMMREDVVDRTTRAAQRLHEIATSARATYVKRGQYGRVSRR